MTDLAPGTRLAGYRLERLIGTGGMGSVYLATDLALDRRVAVKVIRPELADDDRFRRRFLAECKLIAQLEHPAIVPVYSAGESEGRLFIAMRYLAGGSLDERLRRDGPVSPAETIAMLAPVADALDAAHAAGVVHRDVTPGNILLEGFGAFLCDFGLARRAESARGFSREDGLTVSATLGYVAPEQLEGDTVDGRTDQYALACVLFQCLAGQQPFPRDVDLAVVYAHLSEPPPSLCAINPALPPAVNPAIERGLAKRREDRFATCAELLKTVDAALRLTWSDKGAPPPLATISGAIEMGVVEELIRAREAYDRREWLAAYDGLSDAAPDELTPDDFVQLATAAYLLGRRNNCMQALQRAYQLNLDAGDVLASVRSALWLAMVLLTSGETAIGGGWVARSQRLLAEINGDVVERGYLIIQVMYRHIFADEFDAASQLAEQITDYGHRYRDPDLIAMGLSNHGRMLLYGGRVPDGLALLDESMVGVAAGEVSAIFAGMIYCSMIEACQEIADFDRAARWTTALTTWCAAQPGLVPFTGQCAVHRGQIMRAQGAFDEALTEYDLSVQRYLANQTPGPAGLAMAERGDVLRIRGDLASAQAAYEQASAFGHETQPGQALLWLAQGRTEAAVTAIQRLLGETGDPVHRSQLLPTAVDVLLATHRRDEAAALASELESIAGSFGCPSVQARADVGAALVALESGDPATAMPLLRRARAVWERLGGRYEIARCRMLLGRALRALGDDESAVTELSAARRSFADLGAAPAEREAAALITTTYPGGLTAREVEVLRLVAAGKTNPEIATLLFLSEKTVARHLNNIFTKLDVTSRTAAAAIAFEHHIT